MPEEDGAERSGRASADAPFPYGYYGSMVSGGTIAAPLLAGFSFTLVALVLSTPENLRYADAALALLVVGATSFVTAVQCTYCAQQWVALPSEIDEWASTKSEEWRLAIRRLHVAAFHRWAARYRRFFRVGTLALYGGVLLALFPPGCIGAARWVTIGVMATALTGELAWIGANWVLLSSPTGTWIGAPDEPAGPVALSAFRRWPPLRRAARLVVPLVRVTPPPRVGPDDL